MSDFADHRDLPIFIHSELDDLGLTSRAFRVYAHLARRAGKNGAFPSYTSMGKVCFAPDLPDAKEETWKRLAIQAVKELANAGLIHKQIRTLAEGGNTSNLYSLTPRSEWKKRGGGDGGTPGGDNAPGGVIMHPGGDNAPKGIPIEDTPFEEDAPFLVDGLTAGELASQHGKAKKYCQDYDWRIHRDIYEAAVDAMGKRALVDAGNDRTIGDLQQAAVILEKVGQTASNITDKAFSWKTSYFGQRNGGVQQFIDFMATEAPPVVKQNSNGNGNGVSVSRRIQELT